MVAYTHLTTTVKCAVRLAIAAETGASIMVPAALISILPFSCQPVSAPIPPWGSFETKIIFNIRTGFDDPFWCSQLRVKARTRYIRLNCCIIQLSAVFLYTFTSEDYIHHYLFHGLLRGFQPYRTTSKTSFCRKNGFSIRSCCRSRLRSGSRQH